ncbi:MAG: hydratase, partial [Clostridia bacterium]|nr:hydratase [Clostridia bacterium]
MAELIDRGVFLKDGIISETGTEGVSVKDAAKKTIARRILDAHNSYGADKSGLLGIRFDAMASHDITYVGIIQTARASGLREFPLPYVLTNCHNSLCAVGGTINEDDHVFGLSAAKRYGGIFVPPHIAVIHQYMREKMSGCGRMIIGSDSHTRYGALGTLGVGEGGPELVKQLLGRYWEIRTPEVVLVYLKGKPRHGTGPQDVALSIIKDVFKNGFVKNRILEFAGPGVHELSMDFRNGIDVMTTETACLSSVWTTDEKTREYFRIHGREKDFKELKPGDGAYYDRAVVVDLSKVESMIALPFHPSNAYTVHEFLENAEDILRLTEKAAEEQFGKLAEGCGLVNKYREGRFFADQGVIAGCSGGTYENIMRAAAILDGKNTGAGEYSLSVYPASQPVNAAITANGTAAKLMNSGAVIKTSFCGPCFGAGDVPANNGFSIRHTTRNFPNREGSRPQDGQLSWVALMDAASIAATSANGGVLTAANDVDFSDDIPEYVFDDRA